MSLEASLKALLNPLVSNHVYPDVSPQNPQYPLIVYQQVGGQAIEFTEKALPDHDHARIQIYIWCKNSREEASALARAVRAAIIGSSLIAETYAAAVSEYQEDLKLYGNRTDFGIWYLP